MLVLSIHLAVERDGGRTVDRAETELGNVDLSRIGM